MGATAEGTSPSFSNSFTMSHISWSWSMDGLAAEVPLVEACCDVPPAIFLRDLQDDSSSPLKSMPCMSTAPVSPLLDSVPAWAREGSVEEACNEGRSGIVCSASALLTLSPSSISSSSWALLLLKRPCASSRQMERDALVGVE